MPRLAEIFTGSLRHVRAHAGRHLAVQGVPLVLVALLVVAPPSRLLPEPGPWGESDLGGLRAPLAFVESVAALALFVVALGLGLVVADQAERGLRPGPREAWSALRPRLGNLLGTAAGLAAFVVLVPLAVGMVSFGRLAPLAALLVLFFLGAWYVVAPVSVLERRRVGANFDRSARLTDKSMRTTFALALLVVLPATVAVAAWSMPRASPLSPFVGVAIVAAGLLASGLFFAVSSVRLYRALEREDMARALRDDARQGTNAPA